MSPDPGAVVVELTDITPPVTFTHLADALAALWESMRLLPLGDLQHDWFGYYLTHPDAARHVTDSLARTGDLALSFTLPGHHQHLLRIRPAPPLPT